MMCMMLLYWPLTCGLLHLAQRGGAAARPSHYIGSAGRLSCVESVRWMTTRGRTAADRCVVVVDTLHARSTSTTAVSANTTGAATSNVRRARRSYRWTDVADRRDDGDRLELAEHLVVRQNISPMSLLRLSLCISQSEAIVFHFTRLFQHLHERITILRHFC